MHYVYHICQVVMNTFTKFLLYTLCIIHEMDIYIHKEQYLYKKYICIQIESLDLSF